MIIEVLKEFVDTKEILKQTLFEKSLVEIEYIENELKKKEPKIKPNKGCVQIKIGKKSCLTLRE